MLLYMKKERDGKFRTEIRSANASFRKTTEWWQLSTELNNGSYHEKQRECPRQSLEEICWSLTAIAHVLFFGGEERLRQSIGREVW